MFKLKFNKNVLHVRKNNCDVYNVRNKQPISGCQVVKYYDDIIHFKDHFIQMTNLATQTLNKKLKLKEEMIQDHDTTFMGNEFTTTYIEKLRIKNKEADQILRKKDAEIKDLTKVLSDGRYNHRKWEKKIEEAISESEKSRESIDAVQSLHDRLDQSIAKFDDSLTCLKIEKTESQNLLAKNYKNINTIDYAKQIDVVWQLKQEIAHWERKVESAKRKLLERANGDGILRTSRNGSMTS